ncbi:MAG: UDP-N-acetylmuramate dehydrogenase [Candidatus Niyogibacteria bacterium]|nr:UDP-N-acetylmuramate dehydrogenase [Candidatus Niyogibacteria bacterium]
MEIKENIALAEYSLFGIGGSARYFAEATSAHEAVQFMEWARECKFPVFVLGGGSNILVADEGFDGLVIRTAKMRGVEFHGENFAAEAGVAMGQIARLTAERGLAGMEWAIGIPGTLGGSIRGNAGCYGGEIKDALVSVTAIDLQTGEKLELDNAACKFNYRDSVFKRRPELVILSAEFKLSRNDAEISRKLIKEYALKRVESQDVGAKCAGCFFKNADWRVLPKKKLLADFPELEQFEGQPRISAGFLIDQAGLLGYATSGAKISEKHGNFIINAGGASARDIATLADLVKGKIFARYGIALEEEVQRVGFV